MYFVNYNFRIFFLFIGFFLLSESIKAQKPGWLPPNAALYSFNTSVTAVIKFDGGLTTTLGDTIAFYVGDQIRGISIPIKIGNDIRHYATIYSSLTSEYIKLKVYHAVSNKVYDVKDSLTFIAQSPIGNYEKPYEVVLFSSGDAPVTIDTIEDKFTLQNIPFDTIDLPLFLNQPDADLVTWSVSPHPDFVTKFFEGKLLITPRNGFIGSGVIEIKATEQTINANYANQNIKLNVLKTPVPPGWDSIPGQAILKGNSFKSFLLTDYENKSQGDCLVFDYLPILPEIVLPEPVPQWVVQQTYLNSMTFIARPIFTPILPFNHPDDFLAAFIDGELRGVAEPQVINGQTLYFLGVGSQQSVGVITFHFYSGALKRKFIAPVKIPYITSAVRGSVEIPYEINLSPIQPFIDSNNLVQLQIIDSAWVGKIVFRFHAKDCSYTNLSAASKSILESFTYVPFWITSNNTGLFTYYKDFDGDGFGDPTFSQTIANANPPVNYSSNKLDCDDNDDAINPYPTVKAVQDKSFCFGMLTDTIVFNRGANGINSQSSKTIFKWTNNNTSIGLGVSGDGNITPFLTINKKNKNDTAQIIVTSEINGCFGTKDTFLLIVRAEALSTYYKDEDGDGFGNPAISVTICDLNAPANYVSNKLDCDDSDKSIKPYPTLTAVQDKSFCFGMLTDSIHFTRSVNGIVVNSNKISFKWTNNNPAIGLGASGSGNILPFLTKNIKSRNDTAQIIVTPQINGCLGIKDTFLLIVRAEALSTYYKDEDRDGFGNPAISVTICDVKAPANYVANKLDCDDGDNTIKPYPTLTAVQDKSFCFGMLTDSIHFTRSVNGIVVNSSKISYKWTNNNTAIGLAASGSGNIGLFLTKNIKSRNDTAQIIVTPEINGCLGIKDTFLLIVRAEALSTYYKDEDGDGFGNPAISVTICDLNAPASYVSNKLDCDDSDNTIKPYPTVTNIQDKSFCIGILTDSIVFTRSVNGMVVNSSNIIFQWVNNNTDIGLVASGRGNILPFLTKNIRSRNDTAQIIVTPEINGCLGIKDTFLLIIKADTLPRISSLNCSSYTISSLVLPNVNDPYQNTLRLPYAFGNGIRYDSMIIKSEGVLGLTMKLKPGTLSKGDGFLEFEISGIPLKEGVAKFSIYFGRTECNLIPPCEINFNVGIEIPKLNSILCSQLLFIPNKIYAKVPYHGKMELPYLGGNEKLAPSLFFQSEGIRGLTAKFNTDTLRQNGGTLRFNLDGMPEQLGNLSMTVEIGSKSCELNFLIEELPVIIPKFFSPNGDGKNEIWEIPYFNILYPQGTVIILDRFGRKLLEYKGNFEGWDGNIGGFIASTGVYWYIVQLEKESIPLKGNFTLMR